MKLLRNIAIIPVTTDKYIVFNTLNGLMDEVDEVTFKTISNWSQRDTIIPESAGEQKLYENLLRRGYLFNNDAEEDQQKSDIMARLRERERTINKSVDVVTFILTYDCNFRCPYCYEANGKVDEQVMTKEMVDAALSIAGHDVKRIGLFGGEPLLPKTRKIVEYIYERNPKTEFHIITNGYYLEEYMDLLTKMNISFIQVTLDGSKDVHNRRRYLADHSTTFDKLMSGIVSCLEHGIFIRIRMNLDDSNYDECISLKSELINSLPNADKYLGFEMQPVFQMATAKSTEMMNKLLEIESVNDPKDLHKSNRILTSFSPFISYFISGQKPTPLYSFCYAHGNSLMFDSSGDIYPCLLSVGKKELRVGKYYPEIHMFDHSIRYRNIESISECSKCKFAFICGGGCPLGLPDYSDLFKPVCTTTLYDIYNIVPKLYLRQTT